MTDRSITNVNLLAPTAQARGCAAGGCAPKPAPLDESENEPREECGVFGVWAVSYTHLTLPTNREV